MSRLKISIVKAVLLICLPLPPPLADDSMLTPKFFPEKEIFKDPGSKKDSLHRRGKVLVSLEGPQVLSAQEV